MSNVTTLAQRVLDTDADFRRLLNVSDDHPEAAATVERWDAAVRDLAAVRAGRMVEIKAKAAATETATAGGSGPSGDALLASLLRDIAALPAN